MKVKTAAHIKIYIIRIYFLWRGMYEKKNFCNMAEIESQIYPFGTSFPGELLLAGEIFLNFFQEI